MLLCRISPLYCWLPENQEWSNATPRMNYCEPKNEVMRVYVFSKFIGSFSDYFSQILLTDSSKWRRVRMGNKTCGRSMEGIRRNEATWNRLRTKDFGTNKSISYAGFDFTQLLYDLWRCVLHEITPGASASSTKPTFAEEAGPHFHGHVHTSVASWTQKYTWTIEIARDLEMWKKCLPI